MKVLISLLMMTASLHTAPVRAEDTNGELMMALRGLRGRVTTRPAADRMVLTGAAISLSSSSLLGLAGLASHAGLLPIKAMPGTLSARAVTGAAEALKYGLAGGAAILFGAYAYKAVRWFKRRGVAIDHHTRDGMIEFFALPLDQQFLIAQKDPLFAKFLIQLNASLDEAESGFKGPSTP